MGVTTSLVLIAVGAILAFAVSAEASGVDLQTVGWILMAVGGVGVLLSLIFWGSWGGFGRSRTTVARDARTSSHHDDGWKRSSGTTQPPVTIIAMVE